MPRGGCSVLHGVNPNFKKSIRKHQKFERDEFLKQ